MNQEVKKLWVDALRSGEYKQGTACLRQIKSSVQGIYTYCCLGVLTDLFIKAHPDKVRWGDKYNYVNPNEVITGGQGGLLGPVRLWAGLEEYDPKINLSSPPGIISLTTCNDCLNLSFQRIAEIIDNHL